LRRGTRHGVKSCARYGAGQRDTGAAPRIDDWRQPGGKWEREYPAWPSASDVYARFSKLD
jgi:hypothetical protein